MSNKDAESERLRKRAHYEANKEAYYKRSIAQRQNRYEKVAALKEVPCMDCGGTFPHYVMQFDHIGDDKVNSISNLITRASWKRIEEEIAKCELVCANCHAIRTWNRLRATGSVA